MRNCGAMMESVDDDGGKGKGSKKEQQVREEFGVSHSHVLPTTGACQCCDSMLSAPELKTKSQEDLQ